MDKKKKFIILGVVLLLIIVSGITYAVLTWNSTMIKLGINTNCFTIDYTKGGDITGSLKLLNINESFVPVDDGNDLFTIKKGMGLSYVNVGINSNCSIEGYGTIYLNVTELSDTFKDGGESNGALGYAILKNTSNLSNKDITIDNLDNQSFELIDAQPITEIGKIELYSEELSNTELNKYLIVVFVDKEMSGNDVTEATFKGNISVEADQKNKKELTPDYCFELTNKDEENKTAGICDYYCSEGNSYGYDAITDVVIPSEIDGYKITSLEKEYWSCFSGGYYCAFQDKILDSVFIPNSVTIIGQEAFINSEIPNINIPNSVTTIGDSAFRYTQLRNVNIPDSVTKIGDFAFSENLLLSITVDPNNPVYDSRDNSNAIIETSSNTLVQGTKNTIIPDSVTIIGDSAFLRNQLTSINIPNSVTMIGDSAFYENQLTSINIPNSVTTIGDSAFLRNQLTSINIPDSVTTIGDSAFDENQLTSINIPNSVTTIGRSAFAFNQLKSINIPDSVTEIGYDAFKYNNLNYVYIGSNSKLTSIGSEAFSSSNRINAIGMTRVDNPNLKVIYNNSGKAFDWNSIVDNKSGTSFVTGNTNTRTSGSTTYNSVEIKTGTP